MVAGNEHIVADRSQRKHTGVCHLGLVERVVVAHRSALDKVARVNQNNILALLAHGFDIGRDLRKTAVVGSAL